MKPPMAHLIDALFAFDGGRHALRRSDDEQRDEEAEAQRQRRHRESETWARCVAARNGFGD